MTKSSATALLCLLAIAATPATAAPDKRSSIASKEHSKEHAKGERIIARLRDNPKLLGAYVANLKAAADHDVRTSGGQSHDPRIASRP